MTAYDSPNAYETDPHTRNFLAAGHGEDPLTVPAHANWVRVPRFFGDAVMIHTALEPLRAAGMPLVVWGPGWVVDLFDGAEGYAAVVKEPDRKYSPFQAARLLREHRPASVICFPKSQRPMLAAMLARVPLRLGCGDGIGRLLLTDSIQFFKQDTPFVSRYRSLIDRVFPGLPQRPFTPFRPRPEALALADKTRRDEGLGAYAVLAPGANSGSKRLSVAAFQEVGRRLEGSGLRPTIIGAGADDAQIAAAICEGLPGALDLTNRFSLAESAAWLRDSQLMIGVDSGLAHLSAACGIPTLTVFGPTRPRHSAPCGPSVATVRKEDLPCLECMTWACPVEGHPCMNQLPVDQIWDAALRLLNRI